MPSSIAGLLVATVPLVASVVGLLLGDRTVLAPSRMLGLAVGLAGVANAALRQTRSGIYTTFVASSDGKLIDIVPATPSILGKDFSFRDWYQGVTRTDAPYVSEAYQTQATGKVLVVAVAALSAHAGPAGALVPK